MDIVSYLMGKKSGGGGSVPEYSGSYSVTPSEQAQTLATKDKKCTDDISVNPIPSQYVVPQGTKAITENGTGINVASYESVDVDVPTGGGGEPPQPVLTGSNALMLIEVPYNGFGISLALTGTKRTTHTVDWGDGSPTESIVGGLQSLSHTYNKGFYWIDISSNNAQVSTIGSSMSTQIISAISGYGKTSVHEAVHAVKKVNTGKFRIGFEALCTKTTYWLDVERWGLAEATIDGYIYGKAMSGNALLKKLTIGSDCSINQSPFPNYMFAGLYSLDEFVFLPTTPLTIPSGKYTFQGLKNSCAIYVPYASLAAYLTAANYPAPSTYTYIGFATYENGATLPTQDTTEAYNVVWYATKADAIAQTNPITVGNGSEIYCRYTAV